MWGITVIPVDVGYGCVMVFLQCICLLNDGVHDYVSCSTNGNWYHVQLYLPWTIVSKIHRLYMTCICMKINKILQHNLVMYIMIKWKEWLISSKYSCQSVFLSQRKCFTMIYYDNITFMDKKLVILSRICFLASMIYIINSMPFSHKVYCIFQKCKFHMGCICYLYFSYIFYNLF